MLTSNAITQQSLSVATRHALTKACTRLRDVVRHLQARISSRDCGWRLTIDGCALGWAAISWIACASRSYSQVAGTVA